MTKLNTLREFYYILLLLIFTLSSSYYFIGIPSGREIIKGAFPELYYLKHISLMLLAISGTLFVFIFKNTKISASTFILLFIPYSIYIFIDYGIVFIQFLIFIISTIVISKTYTNKQFISPKIISIYGLIVLSIPLLDYLLNNGNFLLNSFYGRERLLLGFFHPKEAGIAIVSFTIMILFSPYIKNKIFISLFVSIVLILLYFVDSRNSLLFLFNFLILNFLILRIGLTITIGSYLVIYIFLPLSLIIYYYEEINQKMSNRLDIWMNGIDFNIFGRSFEFINESSKELFISKFHIDNFYLEFFIEAGVIPFIFLIAILVFIGYKIRNTMINNYRVISLYIAFLIFCFFDAGMFSTGNFLNIFVWSIIVFTLSNINSLDYREKIYKEKI